MTDWSRRFDEPIKTSDGRKLVTLCDAADGIPSCATMDSLPGNRTFSGTEHRRSERDAAIQRHAPSADFV